MPKRGAQLAIFGSQLFLYVLTAVPWDESGSFLSEKLEAFRFAVGLPRSNTADEFEENMLDEVLMVFAGVEIGSAPSHVGPNNAGDLFRKQLVE